MRISHEYGHVALHIFYTYPEDEGRSVKTTSDNFRLADED